VNKCTFKRRLKQQKMGRPLGETKPTKHTGQFVIECRELARERFNPKFFYSHQNAMLSKDCTEEDMRVPEWKLYKYRDCTEEDMRVPEWKLYKYRVGYFGKKYEDLVAKGEDMSHYVRLAKEKDARQPYIKDDILDALKMCNNCMSYRELSKHINNWCSPYTIETWLRSQPTYNIYAKNIKPGLTVQNRDKQVLCFPGMFATGRDSRPEKYYGYTATRNGFTH
jgi:hypothetical protein